MHSRSKCDARLPCRQNPSQPDAPNSENSDEIPANAQRGNFSAEMMGEMNADYLMFGPMEDCGQTAQTSHDALETVAPAPMAF
ncbi:hypothetical protein [Ketogulonicigenium vulgare]|uniref:hypothetical protein n=1 Tax=Ketogulonicigenium vulgare TaxID=92945 RepID=UPI002358420D|nr:hypothetical protein [Ketogulonicigenium vulgare]